MRPTLKTLFFCGVFLLTGCSQTAIQKTAPPMLSANNSVAAILLEQYEDWRGTPYRLGGTNRQGIDCSAFMQRTFADSFNTPLPRTTLAQSQTGRPVNLNQLQAGDLVFFKTGGKQRHVGVYIQEGYFLHASTSRGVMLSRLDNPYWYKHYWMARRSGDIRH